METNRLFNSITAIYRPYVKLCRPIFEAHDLYNGQWLVLKDIAFHQPTTLVQISTRRAIEKPTTRKILKVLSDKQLLEISQGTDRRQKWLTLSHQGKQLFNQIYDEVTKVQNHLIDTTNLSQEEIDITLNTLTTIYEQIVQTEEE
ncbi:MarR family transcriptional regulator [Staphylococcus sp. SQ8-PEA]|uniref:MarR family transcriptional regulator n=1 Tax=Staphylococcus marylandisciuri TaxID=2981529 RepID=A0ABT2QMG5_9STAP|nr:MarR family transcriptional regulator [Staphylococcus marylandisciuri]MCU5745173.1 MarR family transcriptional regulator [Staphylococcus marylandisciuri]